MSPVPPPPPAGTFVPSDDWTEDPSFDLSPSAHILALPTSPSSSTSSTSHCSHSSLSNVRQHTSSPLRQSYTGKGTIKLKKREDIEELLDFDDDFDLPNNLPNLSSKQISRPRSSTSSSTSSITRTIIGNGPTGIGTITKLGSNSSSQPNIITGTVKARALALEKSWEADVDFDNEDQDLPYKNKSTVRRLTFTPPKKGFMPPPDALDDLGFDLDGDEEDQTTLKAGATLKAMLPPKNIKPTNDLTIKSSKSISKDILNTPSTPPNQDPDSIELESDFALPLNLTNLTLATQPQHFYSSRKINKPRASNASTATTNTESWDSPSSNNKKGWGWGSEDSPNSNLSINKRRSETSNTSISDAFPETPNEFTSKSVKQILIEPDNNEFDLEEEDMEIGLILPSPTFFSNQRSKELNSILDTKRKPQFAPSPNKTQSYQNKNTSPENSFRKGGHQGDDSFEDGLVLDEPGVELSKHRLKEKKRARDKYPTIATIKRNGGSSIISNNNNNKNVIREKEKAWEKQREQGWGRITPIPSSNNGSIRDKNQSSLGLSFRSNSASATTLLRDNTKRVDSPTLTLTGREKESMRSRSNHLHSMLPPPIPSSSSSLQPQTATPSSRLRHQKSHYHIAPIPQSPNLTRKQSLASLQDAMIDKSFTPSSTSSALGVGETSRYHNSTSRLTMPTSSSKAKSRPPINSIFPTHTPNSSASSSSSFSHHIPKLPHPQSTHENVRRMVDMPKRSRTWGDGSELDSIDDLTIDDDHPKSTIKGNPMSSLGLGKPGRRGHDTPSQPQRLAPPAKPTLLETTEKRKKSGSGTTTTKKKNRKPALIKHFGVADKKKVVGEMTWNPTTLRWEGNESVLKDFDTISVSARPALITHYTGSSVGGLSSPVGVGSTPSAPRIVGDMQFDPIQMKWVSILSPEEDEPDPFEGMADDEDDEFGGGGGTITRSTGRKLMNIGVGGIGGIRGGSIISSSNWTSRLTSESSIISAASSVSNNTNTSLSSSSNNNTWDNHLAKVSISEELWKECKEAEERHKKELKGWIMRSSSNPSEIRERERKEEKRLWEIRNLAMKS